LEFRCLLQLVSKETKGCADLVVDAINLEKKKF
jgi:hypothetical protein